MLLRLLSIENYKLYRRLVIWTELFLLAGMVGGGYLLLALRGPVSPALLLPEAVNNNPFFDLAAGYGFGGLMLVVLVATTAAQEYGWGTLNLLLARGVGRRSLLLAKFLALLVPALLIALVPLVTAGMASTLLTVLRDRSLAALGQVTWSKLLENILLAAFTTLPYGALAFLCAVATRSPVATIAVGAGYGLIGETMFVQWLAHMGEFAHVIPYLPVGLARALATLIRPDQFPGLLPPGLAATGIALYTLVFLGLAMVVFRRQDLSSGT